IVLNRRFVDTDNLIENKKAMKIEEIFKTYGEDYFRKLEFQIVKELYKEENLIISTGGGIVLDSNNITMLKENGIIIFFESSIDNLVNNIKKSTTKRPLLDNGKDIYNDMKIMYNNRKRLYLS